MAMTAPMTLSLLLLYILSGYAQASASTSIFTRNDGDLHITSQPGKHVYIDGIDVLDELERVSRSDISNQQSLMAATTGESFAMILFKNFLDTNRGRLLGVDNDRLCNEDMECVPLPTFGLASRVVLGAAWHFVFFNLSAAGTSSRALLRLDVNSLTIAPTNVNCGAAFLAGTSSTPSYIKYSLVQTKSRALLENNVLYKVEFLTNGTCRYDYGLNVVGIADTVKYRAIAGIFFAVGASGIFVYDESKWVATISVNSDNNNDQIIDVVELQGQPVALTVSAASGFVVHQFNQANMEWSVHNIIGFFSGFTISHTNPKEKIRFVQDYVVHDGRLFFSTFQKLTASAGNGRYNWQHHRGVYMFDGTTLSMVFSQKRFFSQVSFNAGSLSLFTSFKVAGSRLYAVMTSSEVTRGALPNGFNTNMYYDQKSGMLEVIPTINEDTFISKLASHFRLPL